MRNELERGILTVSLDFELIWGTLDKPKSARFRPLCHVEREIVLPRLLEIFERYRIPATWAVVGKLMEDGPGGIDGPIFAARDLVEKIRSCRTPQEIGSHSYGHLIFDAAKCTRGVAETDIANAVQVADEQGLRLRSFVFPRNRVRYLDVVREHGFTHYRGVSPLWYDQTQHPRVARRVGHLWDILTRAAPPVGLPTRGAEGMWNVPASMLYTPSFGMRRYVPVSWRVARARRGLERAVKERKVFHFWFHPTDLVVRMDAMMDGLCRIFETAAEMRERGVLDIRPMGEIGEPVDWDNDAPVAAHRAYAGTKGQAKSPACTD